MGEARRRGTREQRVAQAVQRKHQDDTAEYERRVKEEEERRAQLDSMPPLKRREAVLRGRRNGLLIAALAASLAVPMDRK